MKEEKGQTKGDRLYSIEQIRDQLENVLSERESQEEENIQLDQFDQIFNETILSEQALTIDQIKAILNDRQNNPRLSHLKHLFIILQEALARLQTSHKKKPPKQEQLKEEKEQKQASDDDSFNFDSSERERQSSQDDADDDYLNDLKKQHKNQDH